MKRIVKRNTGTKMKLKIVLLKTPESGNCGSYQCSGTSHKGQFIDLRYQVIREDGPRAGVKGCCCSYKCAKRLVKEVREVDDVFPEMSERGRKTDPLYEFREDGNEDQDEDESNKSGGWGDGVARILPRHKVHLPKGVMVY